MPVFNWLVSKYKATFMTNQPLEPDISPINISRVALMFYSLAPLHIANVIFSWSTLANERAYISDNIYSWWISITYAHSIMLILITGAGLFRK